MTHRRILSSPDSVLLERLHILRGLAALEGARPSESRRREVEAIRDELLRRRE